jgi:hypothetical protein
MVRTAARSVRRRLRAPDQIAVWAVVTGVLLVVIAALSAH